MYYNRIQKYLSRIKNNRETPKVKEESDLGDGFEDTFKVNNHILSCQVGCTSAEG